MATLPVIDMESPDWKDLGDEEREKAEGEEIFRALKENSIVYLRNHGLSEQLLQSSLHSARAFFALPLETKLKYNRFGHPDKNGYTPPNSEVGSRSETNVDILELREAWNTRQFDRNLPTEDAPEFSRDMTALNAAFEALSLRVLAGLEKAMGRPGLLTGSHLNKEGKRNSDCRAAYYPALLEPVPAGAVRCTIHSDFGSITFLLQEPCGGLEVKHRSKGWTPVPAVPDTILLIAADMLEIWTGGELPATKHRVLVPEDENLRKRDRLSLVFFCLPHYDQMVEPPPGAEGYQAISCKEYIAAKMLSISPAAQKLAAKQ